MPCLVAGFGSKLLVQHRVSVATNYFRPRVLWVSQWNPKPEFLPSLRYFWRWTCVVSDVQPCTGKLHLGWVTLLPPTTFSYTNVLRYREIDGNNEQEEQDGSFLYLYYKFTVVCLSVCSAIGLRAVDLQWRRNPRGRLAQCKTGLELNL